MKQLVNKDFKVFAVSTNTNSFGLHQMILVANDGESYKVMANSINIRDENDILSVPVRFNSETNTNDPVTVWSIFGFECPEKIANPPSDILKKIWS